MNFMTREQFIGMLEGLYPETTRRIADGQELPKVAKDAAVCCFIEQLDGLEVTILRYQLIQLDMRGFFNFTDGESR